MAKHPEPSMSREASKVRKRERTRMVAFVVLGVLLTIFGVLNRESVQVDWIVGSGHAPLIVVIALSVLVGAALAWLGERAASRRRRPRPPA